jgi:hypothetical protein
MKVVLEWLRRLRWCARLDPLILSAIVMSLMSVVSAAQTSGPSECDQQCPQTRELVTTVWGGVVTILAFSYVCWSVVKPEFTQDHPSISGKVVIRCLLLIGPVLNPLLVLSAVIDNAVWSYNTRRRMPGFEVLSLLSPWTKDPAKILHGCQVVITVPTVISIPEKFTILGLPSLSEAVVINRGPEEARETKNVFLHERGREVLLQMKNVLPPYDQLTVLQGSSGWATIISAVQSVGYIYGVVVRTAQGLPVSPIEVVALTLSIQILIKALLHNIASLCYRPLHVYLTPGQAQVFVDECENHTARDPLGQAVGQCSLVATILLVSGVVIYYIIHMWHTTSRNMVVPIMLTLVGLYLQLFPGWVIMIGHTESRVEGLNDCAIAISILSMLMSGLVNATSYIFAVVVTIKYWKADRLDAKTSSMLAHIIPYIG